MAYGLSTDYKPWLSMLYLKNRQSQATAFCFKDMYLQFWVHVLIILSTDDQIKVVAYIEGLNVNNRQR